MEAILAIAEQVMGGRRALTYEEQIVMEDVLDAASHWAKGTLPLVEFERAGRLLAYHPDGQGRYESHGYARFLALLTATPDDPRRADLQAGIDALVASRPNVAFTKQGAFTRDESNRAGIWGTR
jgi:hypothetical protein